MVDNKHGTGNSDNVVDFSRWKFQRDYVSKMNTLGWDGSIFNEDVSSIERPVNFYLFDPFITGRSCIATTELADIKELATQDLNALGVSQTELGDTAQTAAIDLLWDRGGAAEHPQEVIRANQLNFLLMQTGRQLLDLSVPDGDCYIAGMILYIKQEEGEFIECTGRPIAGTSPDILTSDQLADFCVPYMEMDITNHPDYLERYPILDYLAGRN